MKSILANIMVVETKMILSIVADNSPETVTHNV